MAFLVVEIFHRLGVLWFGCDFRPAIYRNAVIGLANQR